ncbi:protein INCA1-like [Pelobates fuscus]|uniref:protein INCA1-like n=1 Tax=Pelobates fuscus TaxID=191477 RepID=UPI002FE4CEAC
MDVNINDDTIPFVKRSQTVHRSPAEPILPSAALCSTEEPYGPEFWARLIRQPSIHFMREQTDFKMSSYPVCREEEDWRSLSVSGLETLPSPAELCRKRRKKNSQRVTERRVLAVYQHLQELRSKQSSLEQLKSLKWGGYEKLENRSQSGIQNVETDSNVQEMKNCVTFLDMSSRAEDQQTCFPRSSPLHSRTGDTFPWLSPARDTPSSPWLDDENMAGSPDTHWLCEFLDEE